MRDYEIVSTDSHLEVSPDRWRPYVDREFQRLRAQGREAAQRRRRVADAGQGQPGPARAELLGRTRMGEPPDLRASPTPTAWSARATASSASREMDQDGVDAEILFPAVSGQRTLDVAAIPAEAYVAIARGYNDWLSQEYTAEDPRPSPRPRHPALRDHRRLDRRARTRRHDAGHARRRAAPVAERLGHARSRGGRPLLGAGDRARRAADRARQLRWWRRRRGAGPFRGRGDGRARTSTSRR